MDWKGEDAGYIKVTRATLFLKSIIKALLWKSILLNVIRIHLFQSSHKTRMVLHRNIKSCGLEMSLLLDKGFDNISISSTCIPYFYAHQLHIYSLVLVYKSHHQVESDGHIWSNVFQV